jgi:hypothetical protein
MQPGVPTPTAANPLAPQLNDRDQLFAVKAGNLIVVQHWTGIRGGRHVIAVSRNDTRTESIPMTPHSAGLRFEQYCVGLTPHAVTEFVARRWLTDHDRPWSRRCRDCDHTLPIGSLFCTWCGLPGGGVVAVCPAPCNLAETGI